MLKLLNLVGLEAWTERSGFARDGKDGENVCVANEDPAGDLPAVPTTAWNERGSRGEDCGLLLFHGYCRGPKEGSTAGLLRMHAKPAPSQVGRGQKGSESSGTRAGESASIWGTLFISHVENSYPRIVVRNLVCVLESPAGC